MLGLDMLQNFGNCLELRKEFDQSSLVKILRDRDMKQVCDPGAASRAASDPAADRPGEALHEYEALVPYYAGAEPRVRQMLLLGHWMLCILRIVVENGIIMDGGQDSIEACRSYTDIGAKDLWAADSVFMKEEMHVGCSFLDGLPVIEITLRVEVAQCIKENLTCCCDWCVF